MIKGRAYRGPKGSPGGVRDESARGRAGESGVSCDDTCTCFVHRGARTCFGCDERVTNASDQKKEPGPSNIVAKMTHAARHHFWRLARVTRIPPPATPKQNALWRPPPPTSTQMTRSLPPRCSFSPFPSCGSSSPSTADSWGRGD